RHFQKILNILSGYKFYSKYVPPEANALPLPAIRNNPKWWPYFRNVLDAINGTHINCSPSAADLHSARNCK
ncbi:hypothetical protein B0H16DRAFT_1215500, partial [Mycena metata]